MAIPGLLPANLSQLFHLPKPPISSSPLASGPLLKKKNPFSSPGSFLLLLPQKTPLRQCSSFSFPPILLSFRPISPPPCSPLERGQRNNKKIIIIPPQKAPLLGWGSTIWLVRDNFLFLVLVLVEVEAKATIFQKQY